MAPLKNPKMMDDETLKFIKQKKPALQYLGVVGGTQPAGKIREIQSALTSMHLKAPTGRFYFILFYFILFPRFLFTEFFHECKFIWHVNIPVFLLLLLLLFFHPFPNYGFNL